MFFYVVSLHRARCIDKINMTKHVDLNSIENYIRNKTHPEKIKDKGQKAIFRKSCKYFSIVDGHLTYKEKRRVIFENNRKQNIIHDVHEGINDNRGRESTCQKVSARFYWHGIVDDVKNCIKTCQKCQQQGKIFKRISPELQSIPFDAKIMQQVGVDLCNLPDVNGYKHLVVLIDNFSNLSRMKMLRLLLDFHTK